MKILVISDSHGNIANLKHVMGFAKNVGAKAVIHCGDWNTVESVKTVLSFRIPLYSVLGNADVDPKVEKLLSAKCKKFDRVFLELELEGKKIGVIHDVDGLLKVDILFCGHTHQQYEYKIEGLRIVNPGALEGTINFAVFDTASGKIEFINE